MQRRNEGERWVDWSDLVTGNTVEAMWIVSLTIWVLRHYMVMLSWLTL